MAIHAQVPIKRLCALVIVVVVVAAAIPTYWVLTRPTSSSPCSSGGSSAPLVEPLGAPPLVLAYSASVRVGAVWWFNITVIIDVQDSLSVGQMTLKVVTNGNWTPVPGAIEFLVWNHAHAMVAVANGTNSTWVEGTSASLQSFDTVTVVSAARFGYDEGLMATIPGPCGEAPSAWQSFGT